MIPRVSKQALQLLSRVTDDPVSSSEITASVSPPGVRHHLRRLVAMGLVEAPQRRPLTVRIAKTDVAVSLRDYLRRNPKNADLLAGATLPVLGVLAARLDPQGISVERLSHEAAVHTNTVRACLRRLRDRGLITIRGPGRYALADHALRERNLGEMYAKHRLHQRTPQGVQMVIDVSPLVRVVEADDDLGLPLTATSRFQAAGADVLTKRIQMRMHAFRDDDEISLQDALEDARKLKTAIRTLRAMEGFQVAVPVEAV